MIIYLVQHGKAKPEAEDPKRPLTEEGRIEVDRVAKFLSNKIKVSKIFHSGKLRAIQTAEILAKYLVPPTFEQKDGLSPLDDPKIAKGLIEKESPSEPVMIVGHLPHLSRLASSLLLEEEGKEVVKFRMGGVVCLKKDEEKWKISWIITPDIIK